METDRHIAPAAAIEDLRSHPPEDAARRLTELVDEGASAARKAQIADLLADRRFGDPILRHLDLGTLESLCADCIHRLEQGSDEHGTTVRKTAWQLLDVLRRSALLCRFRDAGTTDLWAERILALVETSDFTFAHLFAQRVSGYGERPLFKVPSGGSDRVITWRQASGRVDILARSLMAITVETGDRPVAILSRNSLDMALVDLACLTSGIVNVMVPATATEADVAYILDHARVGALVVSDSEQLHKVLKVRDRLPDLGPVIAIDPAAAATRGVIAYEHLMARSTEVSAADLAERRAATRIDDLASVMYTSGTTGVPKGICFSQRNIVYKRFARALALPEIGENDVFLSYLPLFHTFGRFLEMTGCIFWGATYCFAEDPSIETLTRQMRRQRASVLISIPMKWMQLFDLVRQSVDIESADDEEISSALRAIVGPDLRWGLSAAGYLDPEIFRFMQRNGIELMSGFGMTEATGGITMTPPGRYKEESLGPALPGIDMTLAEDGELLVKGPYVMQGYLDPPEGVESFDSEGWFHTGDLMEMDDDGFIRIIDRKKEIYKNIHGETIAPQKIENLFRDFESVGRIFLVGDHRPYNTALIYPNPDFEDLDLAELTPADLKDHFRSLVVSANSFLAPYERIIDFAIIPRDFDADHSELTPKGTYRRKVIERSFADQIGLLYRRRTFSVGDADIVVPNWLFQALGITTQDLGTEGDRLVLKAYGTSLEVRREAETIVRIGNVLYQCERRAVDLGHLLCTPRLWLGNDQLFDFAPLEPAQRDSRRRRNVSAEWLRRAGLYAASDDQRQSVTALLRRQEVALTDLHEVALLLASTEEKDAMAAIKGLEHILHMEDAELTEHALRILRRAIESPAAAVQRRAFQVLVLCEVPKNYASTLATFLDRGEDILDPETISIIADRDLTSGQIETFIDEAERRCQSSPGTVDPVLPRLCDFLSSYGSTHPSQYRRLRAFFTRAVMIAHSEASRELAAEGKKVLAKGFRLWLGTPSRVAVDPETGLEYRWEDVVEFSDEVDDETRELLLRVLRTTPIIREASFLFGTTTSAIHLDDILPGGVWVRLLGTSHGKSVFRIATRTRDRGQLDLALNLNRDLPADQVQEEINWLIVCSEARELGPLVEIFGGAWPEHGLWTEEFIPGETLDHALNRLARRPGEEERLAAWWPFAAWAAASSYVDFWNRTDRRLVVADPSPSNVIVPMHDYHIGARLVSISSRAPFDSVPTMLRNINAQFVSAVEEVHPQLAGLAGWDVLFSAFLEIVGEQEGAARLRAVVERGASEDREMVQALEGFLESVARRGFLPRRLFFAAKRYRKWERLNPEATQAARASTLQEIFETYGLVDLRAAYPEVRARFFRETVFRNASESLANGLEVLIARLRSGELAPDELSAAVSDLRAHLSLDSQEDYFLARLSYPYLRPEDAAEFVAAAAGGSNQSEMVVSLEDSEGVPFRIRHALNPKEVGRLHRLFLAAKLQVQFRPEHRFLVALNERGAIIGGLFYDEEPESQTAHMEKIVVANGNQGRGIAGALIEELRNRLRTAGYTSLTTGFFRPQFFYRMGFTVEKRYAGLYQSLVEEKETGG